MDDESVKHGRRVDRHALVAVQQHTGDEAEYEQDEVVHIITAIGENCRNISWPGT